jgi:uncharacterized membrane protein
VKAGFFFAFSICVMKALGKLAATQGIAAMPSTNVAVINSWFLTAFFGTAETCFAVVLLVPGCSPESIYWPSVRVPVTGERPWCMLMAT